MVKHNYEHGTVATRILNEIAKDTSVESVPTVTVALGELTQGAAQPKRRPSNHRLLPAVQSAAP